MPEVNSAQATVAAAWAICSMGPRGSTAWNGSPCSARTSSGAGRPVSVSPPKPTCAKCPRCATTPNWRST